MHFVCTFCLCPCEHLLSNCNIPFFLGQVSNYTLHDYPPNKYFKPTDSSPFTRIITDFSIHLFMHILLNSISIKWSSSSLIWSLVQKGTLAHTFQYNTLTNCSWHAHGSSNHEILLKFGKSDKLPLCCLLHLQPNLGCSPLTRQGWVQAKNATKLNMLHFFLLKF